MVAEEFDEEDGNVKSKSCNSSCNLWIKRKREREKKKDKKRERQNQYA
jgi:hypothetical protein